MDGLRVALTPLCPAGYLAHEEHGYRIWRETVAPSPSPPRGEGAGRRMRGVAKAQTTRQSHPLIRPFGPPSPRGGEGENGNVELHGRLPCP
nr:hypothetical protein SHINE37_40984 [Rhizobiaceae bacterium]